MTDCSLQTIMKEKMTRLRQATSFAFLNQKVDDQFYQLMLTEIQKTAAALNEANDSVLKKQLALANQAYLQGAVKEKIELNSPLLQYVWALALIRIASDVKIMKTWPAENQSENGLINSRIWEQIKETDVMRQELQNVTVMLASRGFVYDTMKIRWGGTNYPGIGYYFSPDQKLVNMDMLFALLMGLEHARAAVFHELAHSCGSKMVTPWRTKTLERIEALEKKPHLTPEEEKELFKLSVLVQLHFYVYDEAENSFASGFGCLLTDEGLYHQDLRYDVCAIEAQSLLIAGHLFENEASSKKLAQKINQGFEEMAQNERTPSSEFSNMKNVLREAFYSNNGLFENKRAEWEKLGIHVDWLQGYDQNGRVISRQEVLNEMTALSARLQSYQIPLDIHSSRSYVIQKIEAASRARQEIVDDIYNRFFKETCEKMYQKLAQKQEDKEISKEFQESQNADQNRRDNEGAGGSSLKLPRKANSKQSENSKQSKDSKQSENSKQQADAAEQNEQNNQRARQKQVADSDDGKDVKSIIDEANQQKERQEKQKRQPENMSDWTPSFSDDFQKPVFQKDINAYNQIIAKYPSELKALKDLFAQLKSIYLDDKHEKKHELIPEGALNDSLDIQSVQSLLIKQMTGRQIGFDDYKHYKNPVAPKIKKAPIDICVFIDVSGSVEASGYSKFALEIGCLLYEAVRKNDCFNVYVGVMTNPAWFLAEPGMNDKEITGNLGALFKQKDVCSIGDEIYDATISALQKITARHTRFEKEGAVHFFYITDGGHNDEKMARPALNKLMDYSLFTTFNWISLPWKFCYEDNCLDKLKLDRAEYKGTKGIVWADCKKAEDILPALKKLLKERITDMKRLPVTTSQWKKKSLSTVLEKVKHR